MKVTKHEWHQVDSQYTFELDENFLAEVYPDLTEDEIKIKMLRLLTKLDPIEDVMNDAWDAEVEIDWDHDYDDWWTSRKGGYDVTYEIEIGRAHV